MCADTTQLASGSGPVARSWLVQIPPEVRMLIYGHLFDHGGLDQIPIRNRRQLRASSHKQDMAKKKHRRTSYYVVERGFQSRSYETTYTFTGGNLLHTAILAVSRLLCEETSHYLYGNRSFDFGNDLEAVVPFLSDKRLSTRSLIKEITLHKNGPSSINESDSNDWLSVCRYLRNVPNLTRLKLVIDGGRPRNDDWEGLRSLSVSDLRLLYATRHESMEWARSLQEVSNVTEVQIRAEMSHLPEPKTTTALIFAAFSGSIETTLIEFLRDELGIPATRMTGQ